MTPYVVAFILYNTAPEQNRLNDMTDPLTILDYIVDALFLIDVFVNFRTTYINNDNEIVCDSCKIAIHYFKVFVSSSYLLVTGVS